MIDAMKQALEALDAYSWEQVEAARAALCLAIEQAERLEKQPTKIFGPNLEQVLNSAGFYKRQPLTDEEIRAAYGNDLNYRDGDYVRFARAIERKHGIGGSDA